MHRRWSHTHRPIVLLLTSLAAVLRSTLGAFFLYDMSVDQGQTTDVSQQNPHIVTQMLAIMKAQKDPNYTATV